MGKNKNIKNQPFQLLLPTYVFLMLGLLLFFPALSRAADSLCALVKIEIKQELTLERQAFDAHMTINNGLSHITLEDVEVEVSFTDEDGEVVPASSNPDNTSASFFIREDSEGITDNGDGTWGITPVGPSTNSELHWLIIPAPGASNGLESGTLYYVGAKLSYTIGGEENITEVDPDYIYVKPMPELTLDYFLPNDVYGDDAFTTEIEPIVPFSLGVRVKNSGFGTARALRIDSAQPEIVENELGLFIGFNIEGSTVNGAEANDSLLADFGDIAPNTAGVARWIMTCTLSGRFIDFEAEFSHSDELGGELTSLINDPINTHFLVRDVLVDKAGRDDCRDFLALDGSGYRVYESDIIDTEVPDQSSASSLQYDGNYGSESRYTLTTAVNAGFLYIGFADPHGGQKVLKEAYRSDGKMIKEENVWLSKTREGSGPWQHFINLFDSDTTGSYTIIFEDPSASPQPPVLQFIPDKSRIEGEQLGFLVEAGDPNGTMPTLSAFPLPVGATFSDSGDGTGLFNWTPAIGQAGIYAITFTASDGALTDSQRVIIRVFSANDTDEDGMDDAWEMEKFGTLDRDGTGDYDGDGISDLDEYLLGTDPTVGDSAPSDPVIVSPAIGEEVTVLSPILIVQNSTDPENDPVTYAFEVYSDPGMTDFVASAPSVAETVDTTSWTVTQALDDNRQYYWRVRATDQTGSSLWVYGSFFVNTQNDAPGAFNISSPSDTSHVSTLTPALEVTNSQDLDKDAVSYDFEVYEAFGMTTLVASSGAIPEETDGATSWVVDSPLTDSTTYFWRAIAIDAHGAQAETALVSFTVDTSNTPPEISTIAFPVSSEATSVDLDLSVNNATDTDGDSLTYYFELDKVDTFDSPSKQSSGQIPEGTSTTSWQVTGLDDNTPYYWRAKANDGAAESPWMTGSFFVNTINEFPSVPVLKNPGENAWVRSMAPVLAVNPALDPDNDSIDYRFELYSDEVLSELVDELTDETGSVTSQVLSNHIYYHWRARAEDEHGLVSEWTEVASFFVKSDGINTPPEITITQPSEDILTNGVITMIEWEDSDPDSNATISLYYDMDNSGEDGTLIVSGITEDTFGMGDSYAWVITGIEGTYYIYAVITDEESSATNYSAGAVTIDRSPPTIQALPAGGSFSVTQSVELTTTDETSDIYYTLDGTDPTTESSAYETAIEIAETTTLKFMAIDAVGNQSTVVIEEYTIEESQDLSVTVSTDMGITLPGLSVYAFTEAGVYTGKTAITDGYGTVVFIPDDFDPDTYQFRADYLGTQFWSDPVAVPGASAVDMVIDVETVAVAVSTAAGVSGNTPVYLFSESGAYLGINGVTDANGEISFVLPVGIGYQFRSDILGSRYWSSVITVAGGGTNNIPVDAGGGFFSITLQEDALTPMEGITVYLFTEAGTYLSRNAVTDASGNVAFDVPEGTYKVRADYLGYQFWSLAALVEADSDMSLTIAHQDVIITINGVYVAADPIEGVPVFLFTGADAYMNQSQVTDMNGQVLFHVPEQAYKVRADYMIQQFWSEAFIQEDKTIEMPMADAEITVGWGSFGLPDVPVYAFTSTGTYLSLMDTTDTNGQVTFRLPEGTYKFRADYQTSQFWSNDNTLEAYLINPIDISTGGGSFEFTVLRNATDPLIGVNCHVFNEDEVYFGVYGPTSSDGQVTFDLADGNYNIRVDHLGYQFWSNLYDVPTTLDESFIIDHQPVNVTVNGIYQGATPLEGLTIYLFTSGEVYQSLNQVTDENGQVAFSLPDKEYKVRVDYLNQQYWSDPFTQTDVTVNVPMADTEITVSGNGQTLEGLPVYVFTETETYLSITDMTDADGKVSFRLPAGTYKFRADYQSSQYWSEAEVLTADQGNPVSISTGGGTFVFTVRMNAMDPLVGAPCYLFSGTGTYLGMTATTSSEGQVFFDLADGDYQIRVDHLGYQFWTGDYVVPTTLSDVFTVQHSDVTINVEGFYLTPEPLQGLSVYLFKPPQTYMSQNQVTDANGQVIFNLPDQPYKVRADYQGRQFWSGEFQSQDTTVTINQGLAQVHVHRTGTDVEGANVYLFSETGAYLNRVETTDASGIAEFTIPNVSYKFRADEGGDQVYSDMVRITAGQVNNVEIDLD